MNNAQDNDGSTETNTVYFITVSTTIVLTRTYVWGNLVNLESMMQQHTHAGEKIPRSITKEKIDQIPKLIVTVGHLVDNQQCCVCMEDFRLNEIVLQLLCSHIHHEACITQWLLLNGSCPLCRQSAIIVDSDQTKMHLLDVSHTTEGFIPDLQVNRRVQTRSVTRRLAQQQVTEQE